MTSGELEVIASEVTFRTLIRQQYTGWVGGEAKTKDGESHHGALGKI